jgi:hypothetical protein
VEKYDLQSFSGGHAKLMLWSTDLRIKQEVWVAIFKKKLNKLSITHESLSQTLVE